MSQREGYVDDLNETSSVNDYPAPHWIDKPRDVKILPAIIESTLSPYPQEADYAMKQMLEMLETISPIEYLNMYQNAFKVIEDRIPPLLRRDNGSVVWERLIEWHEWRRTNGAPRVMSVAQFNAVFDALPFLFETAAFNEPLNGFKGVLEAIIVISFESESVIIRQCISAISILLERNLLSEEFVRICIVPGMFNVYNAAFRIYQDDLRMETSQTLCQLITCHSIRDQQWLFDNFLAKYSKMLNDSSMHIRKNALQIFGELGNLFGEKFSEAFLVPHLLALANDQNWAVRKTVCEVFVKVAECVSPETRQTVLTTAFIRLLNDPYKWVSYVAYQQLGIFIALFANPDITGLELRDGQVYNRETPSAVLEEADETFSFSNTTNVLWSTLPSDTYLPNDNESDESFSRKTSPSASPVSQNASQAKKRAKRGDRGFESVFDTALNIFEKFRKKNAVRQVSEEEPITESGAFAAKCSSAEDFQNSLKWEDEIITGEDGGIAAKCSSTDDLSKLGIDDDAKRVDEIKKVMSAQVRSANASTSSPSSSSFGGKLDTRHRLFLRRLGALPKSPKRIASSPKKQHQKRKNVFEFNSPKIIDEELDKQKRRKKKDQNNGDVRYMEEIEEDDECMNISFVESEDEKRDSSPSQVIQPPPTPPPPPPTSAAYTVEPTSTEFSLSYWSADSAIDCNDEELAPFGSSSNSPAYLSYFENRLDVMKISSPRSRATSVTRSSPLRHAHASSDAVTPLLDALEMENLGIRVDSMNLSMSSSENLHDTTEEEEWKTAMNETGSSNVRSESELDSSWILPMFRHVPIELIEAYMMMTEESTSVACGDHSLVVEIYRHCAFSFPAVCYTLGRAAWPRLRIILSRLASNEQERVRQSIAHSLHILAHIFGEEITDSHLMQTFYVLSADDNADVRWGTLIHLYDFVKCLSAERRQKILVCLPELFPISACPQSYGADWRPRYELISQLSKLCSLYRIYDVNEHISGIALTLADDRVAEVRKKAVILVATIVGALVCSEWSLIEADRDIEAGMRRPLDKKEQRCFELSEQFANDIVSSFARTQKWTRRQTFCLICSQILRDSQCDARQFSYFFAEPLCSLASDRVANVRIAACQAIDIWRSQLTQKEMCRKDDIDRVLRTLEKDVDVDAAFFAKRCLDNVSTTLPVDVFRRTRRIRQREEEFFGDIVWRSFDGKLKRVTADFLNRRDESRVFFDASFSDSKNENEAEEGEEEEEEDVEVREPPMINAVAHNLDDNREIVDMDISFDDEEFAKKDFKRENRDDSEVPMDPAPSTSNTFVEKLEISAESDS